MQDQPIVEQKGTSPITEVVQENQEVQPTIQKTENRQSASEKDGSSLSQNIKKSPEKTLVPVKQEETKEPVKPEVETTSSVDEAEKIAQEEVKVVQEEKVTPPTEEVVQKQEPPKVKKKVQYSKPNRMCVSKIKKVLRDKNGEISFCYDKQKFKNPALEGSITVQINVHKSRNSIWVKKDTLKDRGFRSCMKSKIRDWDFGPDCYGASFKKSYKLVSG